MKTHAIPRPISTSLALFSLCLLTAPALHAQLPGPGQPGYRPIESVTGQTHSFSVGQLTGKPVRNAQHEELSRISEFLIDPRSGRVHFAVVTAGGNTFRLVPMSALQPGSGTAGLVVGLDRGRWDQIPTMSEQELLSSVTLDSAAQQRFQQQFGLPGPEQAVQGLIRSTLLNERELRAGHELVGTVDDVVIDFHNRISAPLVRMKPGFGSDGDRVLVHFSALNVSPEHRGVITTNLTRNDFLQRDAAGQLAPTGHPSGFHAQQAQAQQAAQAVQQALDRDGSMPRGSVQAYPETRVVLRGAVDNEQKRQDVERAAQQAAPGVPIVNQLMVRNR